MRTRVVGFLCYVLVTASVLATPCITLTCPSNIVVSTCSNCVPVTFAALATNTCCSNNVAFYYSTSPGSCFPLGTTTVQVTAYDPNCTGTLPEQCSFTVTVLQNTNGPSLNCSNIVVTSCTNTQVFFAPTVTDPCCTGWTLTYTPTNGSYFAPGTTNTVQCQVLDYCGLSNNCSFTVTVLQGTNCPNCLQVQCPNPKTEPCGSTTWSFDQPIAISCCTNYFYTSTGLLTNVQIAPISTTSNGTCPTVYTQTWQISDGCGDSTNCSQVVTVPCCSTNCITLTCPSNIVVTTCSNCVPVYYTFTATNACCSNRVAFATNYPSGTCFPLGTSTVQITAYDPDCASTPPATCSFTVTVNQGTNCCSTTCCGPGLGLQTINWLEVPTNGTLSPNPSGSNTNGTWFITNLPCYGNVLVTQDAPTNVEVVDFQNPSFNSAPNINGAFNYTEAGYGPYQWGITPGYVDPYYNHQYIVNGINEPLPPYHVNFYFLDGQPNPCSLILAIIGVAQDTTNTLSQSVTFRTEFDLTNISPPSAYTMFNGVDEGSLITGVSGVIAGSAYSATGYGDPFNTGWAIFQPDTNLLTTVLPPGSGSGWPGPLTNVPYLTTTINHQPGDGFGLTLGYICCARCPSNCLVVQCPSPKTEPCGSTNWTFDLPTASSCCTNLFSNGTGSLTNVLITPISTMTNTGCPEIITQTWTISDGCGDSTNCSQVVTVPCCSTNCISLTCPSNIDVTTCSNCVPVYYSATATDCCSNVAMITYTPASGSCFGLGTTTVQVTAYACGLITNCSFTVTVTPSTNGGANCLQVQCPTNNVVKCGANWHFDPPTATSCCTNLFSTGTGNLTNVLITSTGFVTNGSCPQVAITETWLITDGCCDSATCSQTITVVGSQPPVINCPSNIEVSSCTNMAIYYTPTAIDPCSGSNLVVGCNPPSGSYFAPGTTNTVTCTATNCGGTNSCSFTVTVLLDGNCCPGSNLVCNGSFDQPVIANNNYQFVTNLPCWTTTDSQGEFEIWAGNYGGITCYPSNQSIEINAQDGYETVSQVVTGLNTNCEATFCFWYTGRQGLVNGTYNNNFTVSLTPNIGPAYFSEALDPPIFASIPSPGWLEFCTNFVPTTPTLTISFLGDPHSAYPEGAHIDDVTLTQCCTNSCLSVDCPTNKTVQCGSTWSFDPPTATSCCSNIFTSTGLLTNVLISPISTMTNTGCPQVITQTWSITDGCGDTDTCSQVVTVINTNRPVILNCPPPPIIVPLGPGCVFAIPPIHLLAAENCTPTSSLIWSQTPAAGTIFPPSSVRVTVTVTDPCGHSTNCVVLVQSQVQTGPVVSCPTNMIVTNCTVPLVPVTILSNCCPSLPTISQSPPAGSSLCPGINSVRVTVTDCHGASTTEIVSLTVAGPESFLDNLTNTGASTPSSSLTSILLADGVQDVPYSFPAMTTSGLCSAMPSDYNVARAPVVVSAACYLPSPCSWNYLGCNEYVVWDLTSPASKWIAPNFTNNGCDPCGLFTYSMQFILPAGINPATATISGRYAADDGVNGLELNLHSLATPLGGWSFWTSFTIPAGSPFLAGLNTLTFEVTNYYSWTGLRVEFTNAYGNCCTCSPPTTQPTLFETLPIGSTATFTVSPGGTPPFTYQWYKSGPLANGPHYSGVTTSSLRVHSIGFADAGIYYCVISNACGVATDYFQLRVTLPMPFTNALWNVAVLTNPLAATIGPDLIQGGASLVSSNYSITSGTTGDFGLPEEGGQIVNVMHILPHAAPLIQVPLIAAAGSASDNSYTILMDLYEPDTSLGTPSALFESIDCCVTNLGSGGQDGIGLTLDAANNLHIVGSAGGVSFDSGPAGVLPVDAWNRVGLVMSDPEDGVAVNASLYLNGLSIANLTVPASAGLPINWSNSPPILLSVDPNAAAPNGEFYASSIQFYAAGLSPQAVASMGSPDIGPAPVLNSPTGGTENAVLSAAINKGQLNITWSGSPFVLQETTDLAGGVWVNSLVPFTETESNGLIMSTATINPLEDGPAKFYRLANDAQTMTDGSAQGQ